MIMQRLTLVIGSSDVFANLLRSFDVVLASRCGNGVRWTLILRSCIRLPLSNCVDVSADMCMHIRAHRLMVGPMSIAVNPRLARVSPLCVVDQPWASWERHCTFRLRLIDCQSSMDNTNLTLWVDSQTALEIASREDFRLACVADGCRG